MARCARTTITVRADLKAQMDAIEGDVNWSAVACRAFERELAEIMRRKGAKNVEDAIVRLRSSKQKFENEQYTQGNEAGKEWAKDEAEAEELIRLEQWRDGCTHGEWPDCFVTDGTSAWGASENFVFRIWPEEDGNRDAAQNFWEQRGAEGYPRDEFVRGFAEGALEIWGQVKGKL